MDNVQIVGLLNCSHSFALADNGPHWHWIALHGSERIQRNWIFGDVFQIKTCEQMSKESSTQPIIQIQNHLKCQNKYLVIPAWSDQPRVWLETKAPIHGNPLDSLASLAASRLQITLLWAQLGNQPGNPRHTWTAAQNNSFSQWSSSYSTTDKVLSVFSKMEKQTWNP